MNKMVKKQLSVFFLAAVFCLIVDCLCPVAVQAMPMPETTESHCHGPAADEKAKAPSDNDCCGRCDVEQVATLSKSINRGNGPSTSAVQIDSLLPQNNGVQVNRGPGVFSAAGPPIPEILFLQSAITVRGPPAV